MENNVTLLVIGIWYDIADIQTYHLPFGYLQYTNKFLSSSSFLQQTENNL